MLSTDVVTQRKQSSEKECFIWEIIDKFENGFTDMMINVKKLSQKFLPTYTDRYYTVAIAKIFYTFFTEFLLSGNIFSGAAN